ncbi:thiolase family protein [Dactylosporangium sp. NPDC005572]|uniref:thiolase family protein n=1 Tax=Dactylosporangium sp. NPDC005572 TaxID=3156889 RepID=UPI0033AF0EA9
MTGWRKASIAGVGASRQGKLPGETAISLATEAFTAALADAGLEKSDVDGLLTMPGSSSPEGAKHYLALGEHLGIDPVLTGTLNMGGATAGALVQQAAMAVATGMASVVACVFGDAARTRGSKFDAAQGGEVSWGSWGMFGNAANSAMGAARHMALYGTTSEQLGWVAVNGRRNAARNPNAVMREPMTIEDHQASRFIVEPLHLLDCCLITDGGVAVIVTSPERARDLRKPAVDILGMGQGHTLQTFEQKDWWYLPHQEHCVARAYRMAGVGPQDIDVAQLYDNFTIAVLLWLEHAGFCKPGESGPFVEGGTRIAIDGELPVNTAGGNLSESYMQGWLHVVEGVRQLRGEGGERQVRGAETTLVTGRGMTLNTASALVLGKGR